jgi:hypothetical protein
VVRFPGLRIAALVVGFLLVKPALSPLEPTADHWQGMQRRMGEWLASRTRPGVRILFEDRSPWAINPPAVRWYARREFIGGPFTRINLKHRFASAATRTGGLFGKRLEELQESDWVAAIRVYNLGYVATFSPQLQAALERHPRLFVRKNVFHYANPPPADANELVNAATLFEVADRPESALIEGSAIVTADFDRISVRRATPGRLVLPYHWMDGLTTSPALPAKPLRCWRDPIPFIEVVNGDVEDFEIRWRRVGLAARVHRD